jgi:hypothetical protein
MLMPLAFLLLNSLIFAQVSQSKPGPELKRLDYFVGTWTLEGDFKPGPMGPGGKVIGTDRYEWLEGGFFLVMHSNFKSSEGDGSSLGVMGYNPQDSVYTYDSYASVGDAEHATGTISSDTWIWAAHAKIGRKNTQSRFLMKPMSPTSYSFQYVMSEDGINWTTVMEGIANKVK